MTNVQQDPSARNTPPTEPPPTVGSCLFDAHNLVDKMRSRLALLESLFLAGERDVDAEQATGIAYAIGDVMTEAARVGEILGQMQRQERGQPAVAAPGGTAPAPLTPYATRSELMGFVGQLRFKVRDAAIETHALARGLMHEVYEHVGADDCTALPHQGPAEFEVTAEHKQVAVLVEKVERQTRKVLDQLEEQLEKMTTFARQAPDEARPVKPRRATMDDMMRDMGVLMRVLGVDRDLAQRVAEELSRVDQQDHPAPAEQATVAAPPPAAPVATDTEEARHELGQVRNQLRAIEMALAGAVATIEGGSVIEKSDVAGLSRCVERALVDVANVDRILATDEQAVRS